jgi:phage gp46-like protein
MQDFAIVQNNYGSWDLDIANKQFVTTDGLDTAVMFQLFIDKRSNKDDITQPRNRQGWIGDIDTKEEGYEVGSFIYLKNQSRDTQNDKNEMASFAKQALEYFVAIGAAKNVKAAVVNNNIYGTIEIDQNDIQQYSALWQHSGV